MEKLCIIRKKEGRSLMNVERCVREEENTLAFYVARGVAATEKINAEDTVTSGEFKKQKAQKIKQGWSEMKMHGQFVS